MYKTQSERYGVNIHTPISQLQIVGAKVLSDQNMLYRLLLAYHKYRCVKCLLEGSEERSEWVVY